MPKISIIVPVFNVEEYLPRCIDSILAQTFTDFELILVDDGSPDDCGAICDEYAKKDNRIIVIHKENGGVSAARNDGLSIAKGEYVMFCDSDDYVSEFWCEKMYNAVLKNGINFAVCGYISCEQDGTPFGYPILYKKEEKITITSKKCFFDVYLKNLLNSPCNKIFNTETLVKNKIIFDNKIHYNEDLLFVLKYIQCCDAKIAFINEALYSYRRGIDGSLTNKYVDNLWNIKIQVFDELKNTMESCDVDFEEVKYDYYTKYNWSIVCAISNNYLSKESRLEINKSNREILKSQECKTAFKNGGFYYEPKRYQLVLKTRNYLLVDLYNRIAKLKR